MSTSQSEYLPITLEKIADEAVGAYEAGAAIAHIHVRDLRDGRPTPELNLFRQVWSLAPVTNLKPEMALFNSGSFNFALHHLLGKIDNFKYELSLETATPDEARAILGLKGINKVNFWSGLVALRL